MIVSFVIDDLCQELFLIQRKCLLSVLVYLDTDHESRVSLYKNAQTIALLYLHVIREGARRREVSARKNV